MANSGCPRNCTEATIKDFGVVGIESGWELHIGGNGGVKVRATDVLCRVQTAEEVKERCGAFMQVYREEARYLERTAPWVERVGLTYIKGRVASMRPVAGPLSAEVSDPVTAQSHETQDAVGLELAIIGHPWGRAW